MSGYYSYIISGLPALHFGMIPPFSLEEFLNKLRGFIPEDEQETIRKFAQGNMTEMAGEEPTVRTFVAFETALRNHLVRLRSVDRNVSAEKYLKSREEKIDQRIDQYALEAYKSTDPLESERTLDQARWVCLAEMESGHIFDFSALLIYAMKLRILVKWQTIGMVDTTAIFNATLSSFNLKDLPISRS